MTVRRRPFNPSLCMYRALAAILVFLACAAAPAAAQHRSLGPLASEEGSPLYRLGYTPMAEAADPVDAGHVRFDLWSGYSNIFEQDSTNTHVLYLDMERLINAATLRVGVARGLEVGARVTVETTWGGFLDGFLSGYHQAVGLGNGDREKYPDGVYGQYLEDGQGRVLVEVPRRSFAVEDVRLFAKWRLLGDAHRALSLRVVGRIPTRQDDQVGKERADVAALLITRISSGPWHFHGTLGGGTVRSIPELDGSMRRHTIYLVTGLERNLWRRWSGVVQIQAETPRYRRFRDSEVDGVPVNLVFGALGEVGGGWTLEASFQEDVPPTTPSVDFTVGVRISRRW